MREEIVRRLDTASLPTAGTQRILSRRGGQQVCDCCDELCGDREIYYEIALERDGGVFALAMHRACLEIWMEESLNREASSPP